MVICFNLFELLSVMKNKLNNVIVITSIIDNWEPLSNERTKNFFMSMVHEFMQGDIQVV